jgi:hypothetical protein
VLDTSRFRAGVNLPWITYGCDFGANAWQPGGGLSARGVPDRAKRLFDRLARADATLIRWFLFADGRAGIRFAADEPAGLDDFVIQDVEVALDTVRAFGIEILFTLFDFHWCKTAEIVNGVQLGGRARVLSETGLRAALMDHVVTPLFRAVGGHPSIAGWDVINEPEWVTARARRWFLSTGTPRRHMRRFISDVVTLAHQLTPQPVTVGSASARWLSLVEGLDLDFYQVHWYDHVDGDRPPDTPLALDKPVMLGEFPTKQSRHSAQAFRTMARRGGYFSALPWSALATDRFSAGTEDLDRLLGGDDITRADGAAE